MSRTVKIHYYPPNDYFLEEAFRKTRTYTPSWKLFSPKENEVKIYDQIHVVWSHGIGSYGPHNVSVSFDGGNSWCKSSSFYRCFCKHYGDDKSEEESSKSPELASIIKDREDYKRKLASERRKASIAKFNALPPAEKASLQAKRLSEKRRRERNKVERPGKLTSAAMKDVIFLGPKLLHLKEKIEHVISLMEKGGIDRRLKKRGDIFYLDKATCAIEKLEQSIRTCQERTGVEK